MDTQILNTEDFKSDQMVRWCAGCGDHAILSSVLKTLPQLGYKHEDIVFVSGIGCSSRFPYYVNTYGFHGIHGRAMAVASGVKTSNPNLSVWIICGDGDGLAIGGNHFLHLVRRNIDVNLIMFNNRIYGLTKGQYSPTSKLGSVTKTSPYGTIERPFKPGGITIGANGTYFARSIDSMPKVTTELLIESARHKGTSITEVLQNCVIYNDRIFADITDRDNRDDRIILLKHGEPMIFGKNQDKGLIMRNNRLAVVQLGQDGITEKDLLVHDAHCEFIGTHQLLADMDYPDYPVAIGVIRSFEGPKPYDERMEDQIVEVCEKSKIHSVHDLMYSGSTWEVK
ncbi:MAG: 2-oxoacid:ferredoxin oxidoreductase subunit beta [Bacteroidales bacterium]|nr:2-oxoacid:ferredoxin oxidoreductase subunit beta [Bacteroidales bacterium]